MQKPENRSPILLNKHALYTLLGANAVSGFAQGLTIIAIPWYFISILNKESDYVFLFMGVTLATLFWSLYAGTLIDRYSRKSIFLSINFCGALCLGIAALSGYFMGEVPIGMVSFAFGATIFIFNIHYPAVYAFAQEIATKEQYGKYNSMLEIQGQATGMLAGVGAAMLLPNPEYASTLLPWEPEPLTLTQILGIDAITYCLAFILITFIKYVPVAQRTTETESVWFRMKTGLNFLNQNPKLFYFGLASYTVFVVLLVEGFYLLQMYINNYLLAPRWLYGISEVAYAIGALLAGIMIRNIFRKYSEVTAVVFLMVVTIVDLVWLGFTKEIWIIIVFSFGIGICNAGVRILRITWLFKHVPNQLIGRCSSIFNSFNIFMRVLLLSLFSITFFTEGAGVGWAYVLCALFILVFLIPLLFIHSKLVNFEVKTNG